MFKLFREFLRDRDGAVGLMFGLAVIPMIGLMGAAVDYNRGSQMRVAVAAAADAAALEGARFRGTGAEKQRAAERIFSANVASVARNATLSPRFIPVTVNGSDIGMRVTVDGSIPASVMGVIGVPYIRFSVEAEAKSPENELVDIAFVLDTTDSMEGDRIVALKSASTMLLDDLQRSRLRPEQLRLAVVPFAQYVNIGMGYRNAPWLDVPADYQEPITRVCRMVPEQIGTTNCRRVTIPATPPSPAQACTRDGRPRMCGGSPGSPARQEDVCDAVYSGRQVQQCEDQGGRWVRWNGCVGSRNFPLNTQDANYAVRIPGILDVTCGSPVMEWTNDINRTRAMINGLNTEGETYLPSGLIWGWRMLSTQVPFAGRASTPDAPVRRIMVLVTDGQNTKSPTYPRHDGTDAATANSLTRQICQNMAADTASGIRLYAITFEVGDPGVKQMLADCARQNNGDFFDAGNPAQLTAALQNIGRIVTAIRLTK